jgi:hypothetical protein
MLKFVYNMKFGFDQYDEIIGCFENIIRNENL